LGMMYRAFFGPAREHWHPADLRPAETLAAAALILLLLWMGLFPQAVLNLSAQTLDHLPGLPGATGRMWVELPGGVAELPSGVTAGGEARDGV